MIFLITAIVFLCMAGVNAYSTYIAIVLYQTYDDKPSLAIAIVAALMTAGCAFVSVYNFLSVPW